MREIDERMRNNVVEYERQESCSLNKSVGYSCVHAGKPRVRCLLFWKKREDGKADLAGSKVRKAGLQMEDLPKGMTVPKYRSCSPMGFRLGEPKPQSESASRVFATV